MKERDKFTTLQEMFHTLNVITYKRISLYFFALHVRRPGKRQRYFYIFSNHHSFWKFSKATKPKNNNRQIDRLFDRGRGPDFNLDPRRHPTWKRFTALRRLHVFGDRVRTEDGAQLLRGRRRDRVLADRHLDQRQAHAPDVGLHRVVCPLQPLRLTTHTRPNYCPKATASDGVDNYKYYGISVLCRDWILLPLQEPRMAQEKEANGLSSVLLYPRT